MSDRKSQKNRAEAASRLSVTANAILGATLLSQLASVAFTSHSAFADSSADDALNELCVGSPNTIASPIPSTSPTPGASPMPTSSPVPLSSADGQQAQQYCQAGQSAEKAEQADGKLWIIYAAASAVCTSTCAASIMGSAALGGSTMGWVCTGATVGASVLDGIWTRNYMTALMGIAGAGAGIAFKSFSGSGSSSGTASTTASADSTAGTAGGGGATGATGADGAQSAAASGGSKVQTNIGACISAATTAFSAFEKKQDEGTSEQTVEQSVESLQQLLSSAAATDTDTPVGFMSTTGNASAGGTAAQSGGSTSGLTPLANTSTSSSGALSNSACTSQGAGVSSAIQCAATAGGANMPLFVQNPGFDNAVQGATGMDLGQFMNRAGQAGPAKSIASGLNSLGADAQNAFGNALAAMASQAGFSDAEGTYSRGGGGGGGSSAPNLNSFVSSFMDQLKPKKKEDADRNKGVNELAFNNVKRALASQNPEEDRNLSLFVRVARRYASLTPRMLAAPVVDTAPGLPPLPFTK